ncbi:MAG: 3',5'-nucleoside bisphosphate phosphatase [Burkholderiales bacterium]
MPRYDLHSHSTASDGVLSPADLVARALGQRVDVLALTDHDDTAGLAEARAAAAGTPLTLVNGVEVSVSWERHTIHVVGLQVDPYAPVLADGLAGIRRGRDTRARAIGDSLARAGITGAYEGALGFVTSERLVSRTHFARFLVQRGHVKDMKAAFKRYLVRGKPGYVPHAWAPLADAVGWIHAAGGQAVLAHPGRYPLTATGMRRLLGDFRACGGDAIEILSSSHTPAQATEYATQARVFGLAGSCGSDFHGPEESWIDLGSLPPLPAGVTPVWANW